MVQSKSRDVFTGDDFLAEYARLTKQAPSSQPQTAGAAPSRDATKDVVRILAVYGQMTFDGLLEKSGMDFLVLADIVTRLQTVKAVTVWGEGPKQTIELTDHGRELAKVLMAS